MWHSLPVKVRGISPRSLLLRETTKMPSVNHVHIYIQINGALLVHHVYQPKISLVCHFQPFTTRNVASLLVAERKLCVHHKICDRITKNDFPARTNYEPVENWMAANGLCVLFRPALGKVRVQG